MKRRTFVTNSALGAVAFNPFIKSLGDSFFKDKLRIGLIGIGARGMGHLDLLLNRDDVEITAICDVDEQRIAQGKERISKAGMKAPVAFGKDDYDYRNLLKREDVDAVIVATPWMWHTPMSIDAMKAGKPVATEVAGAFSVEECWNLVETHEMTGVPYFGMENVCYRRDIMAVLNMVRQGLFGEMIHLEGGYQHDLREVKFNNGSQLYGGGVEFGEKGYSEAKWRTNHSVYRNGDLYPTHGIGPIGNMININRGNRYVSLTSMATKARGLHDYIVNHPQGGEDHPNAKIEFALGDVVTTMIKCSNGESILLTHDTNLPRPYSLGFRVQGTKGIWMDINKGIYVEGKSPAHRWEDQKSYMEEYDHPLWKKYEDKAEGAGHGGMDYFVINAFIEALKKGEPMPLDVYDTVSWAVITPLSEESISKGSAPVYFPDFTSGKWINRTPIFALDDTY